MLGNIFNIFSMRQAPNAPEPRPLSGEFRNRHIMLLRDTLQSSLSEFLVKLQHKLAYLHGIPALSRPHSRNLTPEDDVLNFLLACDDAHVLDAIEYMFQLENGQYFCQHKDAIIDQINEFFNVDDLPYYLTKSVWEEIDTSFYRTPTKAMKLREHPKVIRRDSDAVHKTAIEPALALLRKHDLLNANEEFMLALEEYRKGEYRDCVTKCSSSIESVMKVICDRNEYSYKENDTAALLLKTILNETNLEPFWEQPILLIATIRNRLSYSHGSGLKNKDVPPHIAKFSINATAAAILLLHDEAY